MVKSPPAQQETWVRSLGQENPLEEEQQPRPAFLPEKSQGQRSLGRPQSTVTEESDMAEHTHTKTFLYCGRNTSDSLVFYIFDSVTPGGSSIFPEMTTGRIRAVSV